MKEGNHMYECREYCKNNTIPDKCEMCDLEAENALLAKNIDDLEKENAELKANNKDRKKLIDEILTAIQDGDIITGDMLESWGQTEYGIEHRTRYQS